MKTGKFIKWIIIAAGALPVLAIALVFLVICGPRPEPVEGTERPPWLPVTCSDVFYRSQEGFGWWKDAEFTIGESDLRAFAAAQGWDLHEELNHFPSTRFKLRKPKDRPAIEEDFQTIPRALVYERRASNNGGITLVYDLEKRRGYYSASHR
jgi:hypothetical protein